MARRPLEGEGGRPQEVVDANFKFCKRVTDDREFARLFVDWLFERFRKSLAE